MSDRLPKYALFYKSGSKKLIVIRESVADTVPVQHNDSRQNLAEELISPRAFHLECVCEAEMKSISQGWGAALEGPLEKSVDVASDNSRLSSRIFSGVISKITIAFHNMMQSPLDCSLTAGFINQFSSAAV